MSQAPELVGPKAPVNPLDPILNSALLDAAPSGRQWPLELEGMALAIYAETGSVATASRETGIPKTTIYQWVNDERGLQLVENLRISVRVNQAHKLAAMSAKALDLLNQALTRGDPIMDRVGRIHYVPVKARELAFITSILIDKHALVTGAMVGAKASTTLNGLADKLLGMIRDTKGAKAEPAMPEDSDGPILG